MDVKDEPICTYCYCSDEDGDVHQVELNLDPSIDVDQFATRLEGYISEHGGLFFQLQGHTAMHITGELPECASCPSNHFINCLRTVQLISLTLNAACEDITSMQEALAQGPHTGIIGKYMIISDHWHAGLIVSLACYLPGLVDAQLKFPPGFGAGYVNQNPAVQSTDPVQDKGK
jgi:hypothetical protein